MCVYCGHLILSYLNPSHLSTKLCDNSTSTGDQNKKISPVHAAVKWLVQGRSSSYRNDAKADVATQCSSCSYWNLSNSPIRASMKQKPYIYWWWYMRQASYNFHLLDSFIKLWSAQSHNRRHLTKILCHGTELKTIFCGSDSKPLDHTVTNFFDCSHELTCGKLGRQKTVCAH